MKKINSRVRSSNPIFHSRNKKEDDSAVSVIILRQARKTGKLNLSNRHFSNCNFLLLFTVDSSDCIVINMQSYKFIRIIIVLCFFQYQQKYWVWVMSILMIQQSTSMITVMEVINGGSWNPSNIWICHLTASVQYLLKSIFWIA